MLKEMFRAWYSETDKGKADGKPVILEERVANGFVEGKNHWIETLRRTAYG